MRAVARTPVVTRISAAVRIPTVARTSAAIPHGAEHLAAAVLTQAATAHAPLPVAHCAPVRAGSTVPAHAKP